MKQKNYIRFFLTFLFFVVSFNVFSQVSIRSFTHDQTKYLQELEAFFAESDAEQGEELINELKAVWSNSLFDQKEKEKIYKQANKSFRKKRGFSKDTIVFSDNLNKLTDIQKEEIYSISDQMLKKRMKPFPHFKNYIFTIVNIIITNQSTSSFKAWQESVRRLVEIKNSSIRFVSFLEVSQQLFAEEVLYRSESVKWTGGKRYTFEFDSLPKIVFPTMNLTCFSKGDSTVIEGTSGVFYPTEYKWIGKGGKVYWTRAGFRKDEIWAEIKDYEVNIKSARFEAKNILFYNKQYFKTPLAGDLEEKLLSDVTEDKASYPRFKSYEARFEIPKILDGIDYMGGFSMEGRKIIGSGNKDDKAKMIVRKDTGILFIASSLNFSIKPDRITAQKADIKFTLGNEDSLIHPGLEFKYILADKEISLLRSKDGMAQAPYFNSYHKINMAYEALYWNITDPIVHMKSIIGVVHESEAEFESESFFKEVLFDRLQGIDDVHPFTLLKKYTQKIQSNTFSAKAYSEYVGYSESQVKSLLLTLATKGFIIYNTSNDVVTVTDKLFHYVAAKSKKADYDVIKFKSSVSSGDNAVLNLKTLDIQMNGVEKIFLSDSQNVYLYPNNQKVVIKKNRDFVFDGRIRAGNMELFGTNFSFDYNKFKLELVSVDSMRFYIKSFQPNKYGEYSLERVRTSLEKLSGDLLIDDPNNKSGIKQFAQFPVFRSKKDSYAYWDKKSVQNGLYKREKFFFHLEPFTLDSVDKITGSMIDFAGTFVSGGIFPEFEDKLTVQPDYSLGFIRNTPDEGYAVYQGKGGFQSEINLSNRGLKGNGTITYLTSISQSNEFTFLLDSMNGLAQQFDNARQEDGVQYPVVQGLDAKIHWEPYRDLMHIRDTGKPLLMYANDSKLTGGLTLKPKGMTGSGTIRFSDALLEANLYKFNAYNFKSDTANFNLVGRETGGFAFKSKNVLAYVDYTERYGEFTSNGKGESVEFPINQYISYIERFKWFMDKAELELYARKAPIGEDNIDISGAEFISVNPKQDSLRFVSPVAKYNLNTYFIHAEKVPYIASADARIIPDSGKVVIEKNAYMRELKNVEIIANSVTKYHKIYNGKVQISTRKMYKGEGFYDFVNEEGGVYKIYFDNISVDTTGQTVAFGVIREDMNFTISSKFLFHGTLGLYANLRGLSFSGYSKIVHSCFNQLPMWFSFEGSVDPKKIRIPITEKLRGKGRSDVPLGVYITDSAMKVCFINDYKIKNQESALKVSGYLTYDKKKSEFQVSTMDKLLDFYSPGNYLALNENTCATGGEGKVSFGMDFGQVKLVSGGSFKQDKNADSTVFNMMLGFNFFFNEDASKKMADLLKASTNEDPENISLSDKKYEKYLSEIVGKDEAAKMITNYNLYEAFRKIPDEMNLPLFMYDVSMKWDKASGSYKSTNKIGVGNIYKNKVNRYIPGKIQLIKKRNGDVLHVYLEPVEGTWYYFMYQRGLMQVISSDPLFNEIIDGLKLEKREKKPTKNTDEESYEYMLGTEKRKIDFLKKFSGNSAPTEDVESK